jgi:hypothetical protein
MPGYTSLYSGLSGDQGPDLLRHLSFNQQNLFGTSLWTAWRVLPRMEDPVYFTVRQALYKEAGIEITYSLDIS